MNEPILSLNSVTKSFGGLKAIDNLSLSIESGKIVGIIGPNGSGKTTLFNIISGFLKPDKGNIILKGKDITNLPPHIRTHLGIGRLFQEVRIFRKLSVLENAMLSYKNHHEGPFVPFFRKGLMKREVEKAEELANFWLEFVGLGNAKSLMADELSLGQRKLLSLASILVSQPELLLLDEPLSGLDPAMKIRVVSLLHDLKEKGKTIVVIEHLLDFVFDASDRVILLSEGRKVFEGCPEELSKEKILIKEVLIGSYGRNSRP